MLLRDAADLILDARIDRERPVHTTRVSARSSSRRRHLNRA
jgi:hypothetical protein